jgi:hypothetical protein
LHFQNVVFAFSNVVFASNILILECRLFYFEISVNIAGAGFLYHPHPAVVFPVSQVHSRLGGPI